MLNFLLQTILLGLKNLHLHKLRSLLTALGIIFGVAAVIIMVAIGQGTKQAALEQVRALGAQNIVVRSVRPPESSEASSRTQRVLEYGIKRVDLDRLSTVPGLDSIVPLRDTEQRVVVRDMRVEAAAVATTAAIFDVINLRLASGTFFDEGHYDRAARVCVLGATAARQLFPFQDPIGQTIQIGTAGMATVQLVVVGILQPTGLGGSAGGIMVRDIDRDVYFPLSVSHEVFGDNIVTRRAGSMERKSIELSEIWLRCARVEDVEKVASIAGNILEISHRGRSDVDVKAPIQILRNAERLNRMFNFIMVGIASFSLIVGGIGIMNIMLASVTERTREIGIRRALGAKQRHITLQFLVETTVISLSGGLIGIILGTGVAAGLPMLVGLVSPGASYPTSITTWSVVGSFVVSGMIGIFFGLYPAVMAAKMNPIEALRHE
jgi:putative ABC transport system permease protein